MNITTIKCNRPGCNKPAVKTLHIESHDTTFNEGVKVISSETATLELCQNHYDTAVVYFEMEVTR